MTFDQCAPGRCVVHEGLGPGIVHKVENGLVEVIYNGRNGKTVQGLYDRRWFEIYPNVLTVASHSSASTDV